MTRFEIQSVSNKKWSRLVRGFLAAMMILFVVGGVSDPSKIAQTGESQKRTADAAHIVPTGIHPDDPGFSRLGGVTVLPINHDVVQAFFDEPSSGLSTCGQFGEESSRVPVDPAFADPETQRHFSLINQVCHAQATIFCREGGADLRPIGPATVFSVDGVCRMHTAGHLFDRVEATPESGGRPGLLNRRNVFIVARGIHACVLDWQSQEISTRQNSVGLRDVLRGRGRPIVGVPSSLAFTHPFQVPPYGHVGGGASARIYENNSDVGYLDYAWQVLPRQMCEGRPAYTSAEISAARNAEGDVIQSTSISGVEFVDYTPQHYDDGSPTQLASFRPIEVTRNGREALSDFASFPGTSGGFVWKVLGDRPVPFYMVTAEDPLDGLYVSGSDDSSPAIAAMQSTDETYGMILPAIYTPPMRLRQ